jgi:multiple sugar transport system substrate-binding protein
VTTWYAGNRMRPFVDAGLFADVSDVWEANGFSETLASTKPSMTVDGKQYGVPYTYYQWGVYYRKDIFDESRPVRAEDLGRVPGGDAHHQ